MGDLDNGIGRRVQTKKLIAWIRGTRGEFRREWGIVIIGKKFAEISDFWNVV
jgi:hypothetical protein